MSPSILSDFSNGIIFHQRMPKNIWFSNNTLISSVSLVVKGNYAKRLKSLKVFCEGLSGDLLLLPISLRMNENSKAILVLEEKRKIVS